MTTSAMTLDARTWRRWTTECRTVVTDITQVGRAFALANELMDDIGAAIDRYSANSEISRLGEGTNTVSPMLALFLAAALDAARDSDGLVDPTVGAFGPDAHPQQSPSEFGWPRRLAGAAVELSDDTVTLGPGAIVDLGATGKALAADLIARHIHRRLDTGVLVSLGGDIATAGAGPSCGWQVDIRDASDDSTARFSLVPGAAVATSSTLHRRWRGTDGVERHHIIDPRTGRCAQGPWRTATVVAPTCLEANTASTAAIIHGPNAVSWLAGRGLPARLVDHDGTAVTLNGFPEEHR